MPSSVKCDHKSSTDAVRHTCCMQTSEARPQCQYINLIVSIIFPQGNWPFTPCAELEYHALHSIYDDYGSVKILTQTNDRLYLTNLLIDRLHCFIETKLILSNRTHLRGVFSVILSTRSAVKIARLDSKFLLLRKQRHFSKFQD